MVSVIIPSFERFDLLLRAIDSVYNQTYKDFEIIVVDDFSSDSRYLSLLNDNRIKYLRLNKRIGKPGAVRNLGIDLSNGEWVAFLDDDDYWHPNKLEEQSKFFENYDFVSCDAVCCGKRYSKEMFIEYWNMANPNNENKIDFNILTRHNILITSSVCVKKEIIKKVNFFDETRRHGEDYLTWLNILKLGTCCYFLDSPLLTYNSETHKHYNDAYV